jgi:hypothetical protein
MNFASSSVIVVRPGCNERVLSGPARTVLQLEVGVVAARALPYPEHPRGNIGPARQRRLIVGRSSPSAAISPARTRHGKRLEIGCPYGTSLIHGRPGLDSPTTMLHFVLPFPLARRVSCKNPLCSPPFSRKSSVTISAIF